MWLVAAAARVRSWPPAGAAEERESVKFPSSWMVHWYVLESLLVNVLSMKCFFLAVIDVVVQWDVDVRLTVIPA